MNQKKILVVDDSAFTRNYHASLLRGAGFQCVTAVDGMDALEKVMLEQFDAIITDINMPGVDGYELTRRVRDIAEYDDTPILIVSTEAKEDDRAKGYELGADFYLVKPVGPAEVVEGLKMVLGSKEPGERNTSQGISKH